MIFRGISFFTFPTRYFHFPLLLESKIRLRWQRVRYSLFLAHWSTSLPGIPPDPQLPTEAFGESLAAQGHPQAQGLTYRFCRFSIKLRAE